MAILRCPVPALALENSVHCCAKDLPYICRHGSGKQKNNHPVSRKKKTTIFGPVCFFQETNRLLRQKRNFWIFQVTIANSARFFTTTNRANECDALESYLVSERLHPRLKNGNHRANLLKFKVTICPKNYTPEIFTWNLKITQCNKKR